MSFVIWINISNIILTANLSGPWCSLHLPGSSGYLSTSGEFVEGMKNNNCTFLSYTHSLNYLELVIEHCIASIDACNALLSILNKYKRTNEPVHYHLNYSSLNIKQQKTSYTI